MGEKYRLLRKLINDFLMDYNHMIVSGYDDTANLQCSFNVLQDYFLQRLHGDTLIAIGKNKKREENIEDFYSESQLDYLKVDQDENNKDKNGELDKIQRKAHQEAHKGKAKDWNMLPFQCVYCRGILNSPVPPICTIQDREEKNYDGTGLAKALNPAQTEFKQGMNNNILDTDNPTFGEIQKSKKIEKLDLNSILTNPTTESIIEKVNEIIAEVNLLSDKR